MTVRESIIFVLKQNIDKKLNAKEITQLIVNTKLYHFNAIYPHKVVGSELSKLIKKNEDYLYADKDQKPFLFYFMKNK